MHGGIGIFDCNVGVLILVPYDNTEYELAEEGIVLGNSIVDDVV